MKNKVTITDLSETLIDHLNAQQAIITELAKRTHITEQEMETIRHQSSAEYKRKMAIAAKRIADLTAYKEDQGQMAAWVESARFLFTNATEWAKAADAEWLVIVDRNASEHDRPHSFSYREPTQAELLEALKHYQQWEHTTNPHYANHRAQALKVLPVIKKKLAALLVA